jgi:DNA invertase Pin-like site-specific DNA recombinase
MIWGMVKRGTKVIGYVRVSTREQGDSGLGLAAQRAAIDAECQRRGWELEQVYEDVASAKDTIRPGLTAALAALESGLVSGLVVAKIDRLSRSMLDFAGILQRANQRRWGLVVLDLGVDTSTPSGKLVATVIAALAEWEREQISTRTKDALAERRAQGGKLGRPSNVSTDVARRVRREHESGASLRTIAAGLNADGVPTAQGGRQWHASTVRAVLGAA